MVEKYRDIHRWNALDELEVKEILDHLAPLVFEAGDDEQAKRFDQLCLNLQLDYLQKGCIRSMDERDHSFSGSAQQEGSHSPSEND